MRSESPSIFHMRGVDAMMATALLAFAVVQSGPQVAHTFTYVAETSHRSVSVAGTFNGWNKDASPLTTQDGRTWVATVNVAPGRHEYKFVLDGQSWVIDPANPSTRDDGNGNINSLLVIKPFGYEQPALVGDGKITESAILHKSELPFLTWDNGQLTLIIQVRRDDVQSVSVRTGKTSDDLENAVAFSPLSQTEFYSTYAGQVSWDRSSPLYYEFVIQDGDQRLTVDRGANGAFQVDPKSLVSLSPPEWVQDAIIYQIFPDRFANGSVANDPAGVQDWDAEPNFRDFKGGDFAGVEQRLNHLVELGVNTVYFNPIFQGPSNHRYETTDYFTVDPRLGTNEEFSRLTNIMDSRKIRTVLDGVFNHTSVEFKPFQDIRDKGRNSEFTDWYFIKGYPVTVQQNPNYEAWFGFQSMPKVNLENDAAAEFMLSVPEFWEKNAKVHGWRLDVANEVPMDFWRKFRKTVKQIGEDTWIVGEVWGDGSPWLKGDQWDSVMNYRFRESALGFIARGQTTPSECLGQLMEVHLGYGAPVSRNMMNLLSSHDTPRFLTLCEGDRKLALLGAILQFTWVGAPSIYYGEELGMEGGRDPDNRRGMAWNLATQDNPTLRAYKALTQMRSAIPALRRGNPTGTFADDAKRVMAFRRAEGGSKAIVIINRSDSTQQTSVDLFESGRWLDVWNNQQLQSDGNSVVVTVPPLDAAVFVPLSRDALELRDRLATRVSTP
ncbi:MAG: alpha-glucosidase C-terminal domain-containing protein [Fimbriimonadaceae bacterium]|nr:alpha-glucosidase C-terminal domain-containing protein [Fimbriimonadaceae bacterium]